LTGKPQFSIVIPSYGRPQALQRCLEALTTLDYPRDQFEAIIVDDESPHPVDEIAKPFSNSLNILVLRQRHAGPAAARNLGVQHARGKILAFVDDDCVADPDWLRQLEAASEQFPGALLGGGTVNACADNVFAATNQLLIDTVRRCLDEHASPLRFFPSNNLAVSSAALRDIGGFDASIRLAAAEDRELCARWVAAGKPLVEVPAARIKHYHPQTLVSFIRMHFRYGRGAALLHRRRNTTPAQFIAMGLYWRMLDVGLHAPARRLRSTFLLALSQVASAAGYFFQAAGAR